MRTYKQILDDPCASYWLTDALRSAMDRDPVDAASDARILAAVLEQRAQSIFANWRPAETSTEEKET